MRLVRASDSILGDQQDESAASDLPSSLNGNNIGTNVGVVAAQSDTSGDLYNEHDRLHLLFVGLLVGGLLLLVGRLLVHKYLMRGDDPVGQSKGRQRRGRRRNLLDTVSGFIRLVEAKRAGKQSPKEEETDDDEDDNESARCIRRIKHIKRSPITKQSTNTRNTKQLNLMEMLEGRHEMVVVQFAKVGELNSVDSEAAPMRPLETLVSYDDTKTIPGAISSLSCPKRQRRKFLGWPNFIDDEAQALNNCDCHHHHHHNNNNNINKSPWYLKLITSFKSFKLNKRRTSKSNMNVELTDFAEELERLSSSLADSGADWSRCSTATHSDTLAPKRLRPPCTCAALGGSADAVLEAPDDTCCHLEATSGRPCVSASPTDLAGCNRQQQHQASSSKRMALQNSLAKRQYENYYDDEHEDIYKRLSASIGMEFGINFEAHNSNMSQLIQMVASTEPARPARCSNQCKCLQEAHTNSGADCLGACDCHLAAAAPQMGVLVENEWTERVARAPASPIARRCERHQRHHRRPSNALVGEKEPCALHGQRQSQSQSRRVSISDEQQQQQFQGHRWSRHQSISSHRETAASQQQQQQQQQQQANSQAPQKSSGYSSSYGSSSGIGQTGSACTNTPTTSSFPYNSFASCAGARQARNSVGGGNEMASYNAACLWTSALVSGACNGRLLERRLEHNHGEFGHDELNKSGHLLAQCVASRKYSLPVQLESQAAESLSCCSESAQKRPLFERNREPVRCGQRGQHRCSEHQPPARHTNGADSSGRNSQTLTRQSSFWLDETGFGQSQSQSQSADRLDSCDDSGLQSLAEPSSWCAKHQECSATATATESAPIGLEAAGARRAWSNSRVVLSGDSIETVRRQPIGGGEQKNESSEAPQHSTANGTRQDSQASRERRLGRFANGAQAKQRLSNSSTSTNSSPSPDFGRASERILSRSTGAGVLKRRLRNRKYSVREHLQRSRAPVAGAWHSAPASTQSYVRSLDEEELPRAAESGGGGGEGEQTTGAKGEQELTGFPGEEYFKQAQPRPRHYQASSLPIRIGGRFCLAASANVKDIDETVSSEQREQQQQQTEPAAGEAASLERECRALWRLRANLHEEAGDNWNNYHQRLSRRYDSGYKSIETQNNSSLDHSGPLGSGQHLASNGEQPVLVPAEVAGTSGLQVAHLEEPGDHLDPHGSPRRPCTTPPPPAPHPSPLEGAGGGRRSLPDSIERTLAQLSLEEVSLADLQADAAEPSL